MAMISFLDSWGVSVCVRWRGGGEMLVAPWARGKGRGSLAAEDLCVCGRQVEEYSRSKLINYLCRRWLLQRVRGNTRWNDSRS